MNICNATRKGKFVGGGLSKKEEILNNITEFEATEVGRFLESKKTKTVFKSSTPKATNSAKHSRYERSQRMKNMKKSIL